MSENKQEYGPMNIVRVKKDANYFAASNIPFNDTRLSWEARGLMGYLLSKPDNWTVRMTDLYSKGPAGETKLRRMLAELRKCGYMNRIRIAHANGLFTWETEIFEDPAQNTRQQTTTRGFSTSGLSTSGKQADIVSTDIPSTDLINDNEAETAKEKKQQETAEVFKAYMNNIGAIGGMASEKIQMFIDEYTAGWVIKAIETAVDNNARNLRYIETILQNWQAKGLGWKPGQDKKRDGEQWPRKQKEKDQDGPIGPRNVKYL